MRGIMNINQKRISKESSPDPPFLGGYPERGDRGDFETLFNPPYPSLEKGGKIKDTASDRHAPRPRLSIKNYFCEYAVIGFTSTTVSLIITNQLELSTIAPKAFLPR